MMDHGRNGEAVMTSQLQRVIECYRLSKTQAIDLTIMRSYGHSRIRQFFVGSQTTRMLVNSITPLLLLR